MKIPGWTTAISFLGLVALTNQEGAPGDAKPAAVHRQDCPSKINFYGLNICLGPNGELIPRECENVTFVISFGKERTKFGLEPVIKNPLLQIQDMAKETILSGEPPKMSILLELAYSLCRKEQIEIIVDQNNGKKTIELQTAKEIYKYPDTNVNLKNRACGRPTSTKLTLEKEVDPNHVDELKMTGLEWAALTGNVSAGKELLSRGADVNHKNENGATALHIAAMQSLEFSEMLVEAGAEVDPTTKEGMTPLMFACSDRGKADVVRLLADKGADVNHKSKAGTSPLDEGSEHPDVVKELLDHGADPMKSESRGVKALYRAALKGRTDVVRLLAMKGVDVNGENEYGDTPLVAASTFGKIDTIKELLARGANINGSTSSRSPLLGAASYDRIDVMKLLVESGADVDQKDANGDTALILYAKRGSLLIAKELVALGSNVNVTNAAGNNALHEALKNGHQAVAAFLISAGIDVEAKNHNGQTPAQYAGKKP